MDIRTPRCGQALEIATILKIFKIALIQKITNIFYVIYSGTSECCQVLKREAKKSTGQHRICHFQVLKELL